MRNFKLTLVSSCICLFLLSSTVMGRDPKITLLYKGRPLCYWTITLKLGSDTYGEAVTNSRGEVEFSGVKMPSLDFDLEGEKKTKNGEKSWRVTGMFRFHDDSYQATIRFEEVIATMIKYMGGSEPSYVSSWGIDDECTEPSSSSDSNANSGESNSNGDSNSNSSNGSNAGKNSNSSSNSKFNKSSGSNSSSSGGLTEDDPGSFKPITKEDDGPSVSDMNKENMRKNQENMDRMRAEQEKRDAEHKAALPGKKTALEEKIQRLNQKIDRAKGDLSAMTTGTTDYSNKSYDLRDLEIERDLAELDLDKTIDEMANGGYLGKSDRKIYNEKKEILENEQKQLLKNRKDGLIYGQGPIDKDTKKEEEKAKEADKKKEEEKKEELARKEEEKAEELKKQEKKEDKSKDEDEDDAPFKIYTPEELANLSTFDLKRTRMSNKNSINKREVKLKVKSSFYTQEKIAKLKAEIESLHKQVDAIGGILAQRNEKEDEKEGEKEGEKKE